MKLLVLLVGGVATACVVVVAAVSVRMGGVERAYARFEGIPRVIEFDGALFGDVRFWKGPEVIEGADWQSSRRGEMGDRRVRLLWAQRHERKDAHDLLAWDLEQYAGNDNHHEGGERLETVITPTTACKVGRVNGELFLSFEVCRDDRVPVCVELRELGGARGGCAHDDGPCLRRSGCEFAVERYSAKLHALNTRLAMYVGPGF